MFVYVALIEMHTIAGTLMNFFTGIPYSHVTFSFDENLEDCHAVQARNIGTPLIAGYVNENKSYWITRRKNARYVKYKIPATEEEIEKIKKFIDDYAKDNENLFNMYSAITYVLLRGVKVHKAMMCGDFIAEILKNISCVKIDKPSYKVFPKDLYTALKEYKDYEGVLLASEIIKTRDENDLYFRKVKLSRQWKKGLYIFKENTYRLLFKRVSKKYDYLKTRLEKEDYKI